MTRAANDHALLMDKVYRYQRHIYDLTRKWYLLGRDQAIRNLDGLPAGSRVLEPGCGTARNLRVAAARNPKLQLFGFDASEQMLVTARRLVGAAGHGKQISVCHADIMAFDPVSQFGVVAFDRVLLSYTLSMVPDWQTALGRLMDCVAPGGVIEIVDFGPQDSNPTLFQRALNTWLGWFHVTRRNHLAETLTTLGNERGFESPSMRHLYGGYAILLNAKRATT